MIHVNRDFAKELRAGIKHWTPAKLGRFLNDIYDMGYAKAMHDAQMEINKITRGLDYANQITDSSHTVDGIGVQFGSTESSGSEGVHADDPNSGEGSGDDVPQYLIEAQLAASDASPEPVRKGEPE